MPKPPKPAGKKSPRDPRPRERAAMDRALESYKTRSAPLEYKVSTTPEGCVKFEVPHSDTPGHTLHGLNTFGTGSLDFKDNALVQLASAIREEGQETIGEREVNAALAAVSGIAPENEIEAMLALQMVATHDVAMKALRKLNYTTDINRAEKLGTIATKMMRTYTAQLEALAKLRRGGEQTVRVEHVHVYQGGQAIVGNVNPQAPGGRLEKGHQPHALTGPATHALPPGAEVLCPDPAGAGMPVAGGVGEAPVPNARRRERKRGASR